MVQNHIYPNNKKEHNNNNRHYKFLVHYIDR